MAQVTQGDTPRERVEQAQQEERTQAVGHGRERLGIGVPAMKGLAD